MISYLMADALCRSLKYCKNWGSLPKATRCTCWVPGFIEHTLVGGIQSLVLSPEETNFLGCEQPLVRGSGRFCGRFLVERKEALIGLDPARDLEFM